ncbi:unnamed protein product [Parnassius apollo]|uniref:(apollo) hypothetical protein n=1 Tax=Parnassius apollo TaxID=110799 RepID=A0A8S3YAC2_PARAO|nr:unnamed protein product [Parnassius apollo]
MDIGEREAVIWEQDILRSTDLRTLNWLVKFERFSVEQGLRAGTVWMNDYNVFGNQVPFGGYKQYGIGRENGPYGIRN